MYLTYSNLSKLRQNQSLRDLIAETHLSTNHLVMPYFVVSGKNIKQPITTFPGMYRFSPDLLVKEIQQYKNHGGTAVLLFGIPRNKDQTGTAAYHKDGPVQTAIREIKDKFDDIVVITDVCLCSYTTHGHCGIIQPPGRKVDKYFIDLKITGEILTQIAVSHASAGADIVAPSAMVDGQVKTIRKGLDESGFTRTSIMSYSVKFSSSLYGPFREAASSSPRIGDRKQYQLDYRNLNEALREIQNDINEGTDMVMVKPALFYLDVIRKVKDTFNIPLAAYNVSGEYTMVKEYSRNSLFVNSNSHKNNAKLQTANCERELVLEIITAIKRAGADIVITYWAKDIARWMNL